MLSIASFIMCLTGICTYIFSLLDVGFSFPVETNNYTNMFTKKKNRNRGKIYLATFKAILGRNTLFLKTLQEQFITL